MSYVYWIANDSGRIRYEVYWNHLLETFQLEICRKHIQWFNPFHPLPIPTCSDALAIEPAKSEENCQLPNTGCNFWRIIFVAKKYCFNSKAITWIIKRKSLKISSIVRCIIEKTRKYFGFVVWRLGYDGGKLSNILHSKRNRYEYVWVYLEAFQF